MKNDQNKQDNVILFPDLDRRLMAKGLDLLQQKKYKEAIRLLEQALEFDSSNADVYTGLILANFESGRLNEARQFADEMLNKGIGDYFQVADLYIMILIQLNQFEEVITTIEVLLQEHKVPAEKFEHFTKMLHYCRKMANEKPAYKQEEQHPMEEQENELELLSSMDPNEQVLFAARLANENIRPYVNELKKLMEAEDGHPFQKTLFINILREQEYDKEIVLSKLGRTETVIPANLPELKDMESLREVIKLLSEVVENENPVLYESIKSLVERNYFIMYPFELEPKDSRVLAAAFHYIAGLYFGMEDTPGSTADLYGADYILVEKAINLIRRLEEISYPNI